MALPTNPADLPDKMPDLVSPEMFRRFAIDREKPSKAPHVSDFADNESLVQPTPEELVERFNGMDRKRQVQFMARVLGDGATAHECFIEDHARLKDELRVQGEVLWETREKVDLLTLAISRAMEVDAPSLTVSEETLTTNRANPVEARTLGCDVQPVTGKDRLWCTAHSEWHYPS